MKVLDHEPAAQSPLPDRTGAALTESARQPDLLHLMAVLGLLLAAAYVRVSHLDLVQFRHDDYSLWSKVIAMTHGGDVPYTGMVSSAGLFNGPYQAYLLAPFGWLDANPPLMTAGVGLYNILGVALVYGFARDFFGKRVGILALLLVAVNPWAAMLSRRLWGDDLVAPFAVLLVWMLARWLYRSDSRAVVVAGVALAVVAQVYVAALACVATAIVAAALAGKRLWSRWAIAAVLLSVTLAAPYLALTVVPYALGAFNGTNTGYGPPASNDLGSIKFALELASGEGYQAFALQASARIDAATGIAGALGAVSRLLYIGGLCLGVWTIVRGAGRLRGERRGVQLLMLIAVVVPVLALVRHSLPLYPYYLVPTFPMPYLYGAIAVDQLWEWGSLVGSGRQRWVRTVLALGVAAIVATDGLLAVVFFSTAGDYYANGNYGMPWRLTDELIAKARLLERRNGAERVLMPGLNPDSHDLYESLSHGGTDDAMFDDRKNLVLSGSPAVYLVMGNNRAQSTLATSYGRYLQSETVLPGDGTHIRYYVLPASAAAAPLPLEASLLDWNVGGLGRLDGILAPRRIGPGQPATITTYLTVLSRPDDSVPNYSIFAHLVRPDGRAVGKKDDATWETPYWRPGDRIVQWLDVATPADAAPGLLDVSLGMYSTGTPNHYGLFPLNLNGPSGASLGSGATGATAVIPPPAPKRALHPLAIQFADGIVLDGYDVQRTGSDLLVTPHWRATRAVTRDLTAFVHMLDASGQLVAQHDSPVAGGAFPTSFWITGDQIADLHAIPLPTGMRLGSYQLEFGMYDPKSLERLTVVAGNPVVDFALTERT